MEVDESLTERLKQRVKNLYFVVIVAGIAVHLFLFLGNYFSPLAILAIPCFVFFFYYINRFFSTPCPNCQKPFFSLVNFWQYAVIKSAKCKSCKYLVNNT